MILFGEWIGERQRAGFDVIEVDADAVAAFETEIEFEGHATGWVAERPK